MGILIAGIFTRPLKNIDNQTRQSAFASVVRLLKTFLLTCRRFQTKHAKILVLAGRNKSF